MYSGYRSKKRNRAPPDKGGSVILGKHKATAPGTQGKEYRVRAVFPLRPFCVSYYPVELWKHFHFYTGGKNLASERKEGDVFHKNWKQNGKSVSKTLSRMCDIIRLKKTIII